MLKPGNQLNTTSGAALQVSGVYGVGIVVGARFDEPIADRAAAERRLTVTTSPPVTGSWYWADDQNAHWVRSTTAGPEPAADGIRRRRDAAGT